MDSENDATERHTITDIIRSRDHRVSWLMGQVLVDLPYNRAALREAVAVPDVKTRRELAYRYRAIRFHSAENSHNIGSSETLTGKPRTRMLFASANIFVITGYMCVSIYDLFFFYMEVLIISLGVQ